LYTNFIDMKEKIVLITGATSGIGKETARKLAEMGAELVLVARDEEKLNNTIKEITASTGNTKLDYFRCDLSSMNDIRQMTDRFLQKYNRLDVLINNAGLIVPEFRKTVDGYEYTFALNHLGYFLTTGLLIETLLKSAPARIISVSSVAHTWSDIQFDDLMLEKKYNPAKAYGQSKLANILFTRELARRLNGKGVTANCFHPGAVNTRFGSEFKGIFKAGLELFRPLMISPQKAAETPVYLASSLEVEGVSGEYFVKKRPAKTSRAAQDMEKARKLWEISEKLTGFTYPI